VLISAVSRSRAADGQAFAAGRSPSNGPWSFTGAACLERSRRLSSSVSARLELNRRRRVPTPAALAAKASTPHPLGRAPPQDVRRPTSSTVHAAAAPGAWSPSSFAPPPPAPSSSTCGFPPGHSPWPRPPPRPSSPSGEHRPTPQTHPRDDGVAGGLHSMASTLLQSTVARPNRATLAARSVAGFLHLLPEDPGCSSLD
jgi:hypothetical protein